MKRTAKRIGSLFLAVCMVMTMLPTVAFAEIKIGDSGTGLGISGEITAFEALDEDVAAQTVKSGTPEDELNLPDELTVTVTTTYTVTSDAGDYDTATDSEAQEPEEEEEITKATVTVSGWSSDPDYDPEAEDTYVFTPVLDLPDDVALADSAEPPFITVTVESGVPLMRLTRLGDTVNIEESDSSSTIKNEIEAALGSNDTVIVTGSKTNVSDPLYLSIGSGKTVVWEAAFEAGPNFINALIFISGDGTLEVPEEGSFVTDCDDGYAIYAGSGSKNDRTTVNISGGMVSADGKGGIAIWGNSDYVTVNVSDGTVSADGDNGYAISTYGTDAAVNVSGGMVSAGGENSRAISTGGNGTSARVNVSGGTVSASADKSYAISTNKPTSAVSISGDAVVEAVYCAISAGGSVTVTGGIITVTGDDNYAIFTGQDDSTVSISDGVVFAHRNSITGSTDVIYMENKTLPSVTGDGIVLAWDSGTGIATYASGSQTDIIKLPDTATANWATQSGDSGIAYSNGANSGFIPLPVTVTGRSSATGSMSIGGTTISDLMQDDTGTGWAWDAAAATLTLTSAYQGEPIAIHCGSDDSIGLVYSGDVEITSASASALSCEGNLEITGTGDTLTVNSLSTDPLPCAIEVLNTLTVGGNAQIDATSAASGTSPHAVVICGLQGVTITDTASVRTTAAGSDASGIYAERGDLTISTSGTVACGGNGTGGGLAIRNGRKLNMSSGYLVLNIRPLFGNWFSDYNITGGSITIEGTQVYKVLLTLDGVSAITEVTDVTASAPAIGVTGSSTSAEGKLCVLLPAGSQTVTLRAGGSTYTGTVNVTSDHQAAAMLTTAGSVTSTMDIGGQTGVSLVSDQSGTGWAWNAAAATLTLDGSYSGSNKIDIQCAQTDNITLVLTEDVTMNVTEQWARGINVAGGLTIEGGSHILTATSAGNDAAGADSIAIKSGTVIAASGGLNGLIAYSGNLSITGSASVTATGFTDTDPIWSANGIQAADGTVLINTSGVVNAFGGKGAVSAANVTIESGTVNANGGSFALCGTDSGVVITGGTVTTNTTGSANGDVIGGLTVSGTGSKVTINGSIPAEFYGKPSPADIAVSGGTVTVTGTVGGSQNLTGGTVWVNGVKVYPTGTAVYSVTFDLNGGIRTGGGELTQTVLSGSFATAPTVTRSNYTFTGWDKAFTGVTSNLTVTASWSYNGGTGSSSGGSYGSGSTTTTPGKTTNYPTTAVTSVTATAGANGEAGISIPEKSISDAIAKAQADAAVQGKTANGTTITVEVTMPEDATSLTATLTRSSLNSLVSAGITSLELNGSPVTVSFDTKALAEIQKQSTGNISITIAPNSSLSASAKAMIGTRPMYDLTVGYGSGSTVSGFGGGTATVSIPYTPARDEAVGGLHAVYVDAEGSAQRIADSAYDANSGFLIFTTTHFSLYGIGYTTPSAKFTDISSYWGRESIDYAAGRGLLSGTTETTFSPDTAMTRGMLVTALGRLAGVDANAYTTSSFTDVNVESTFRPYIEWAYSNGIIQDIGNSQFVPDKAVNREEAAAVLANYATFTGYTLPVTRTATTYGDAASIGDIYKTAVTAMQQAGIMMGGADNKFNPKSDATRGEVSSMLHRYVKLTIDPGTAQGWAKNDAGQYLCYKEGKALTGTQTISGVKYFFNTDGTLKTGWVKAGDDWRFYSGNTMLTGFYNLDSNDSSKTYYFTKDGLMVSGKWLEIDGKWYYFNADGTLARSTVIDGYEVDEDGVRKPI